MKEKLKIAFERNGILSQIRNTHPSASIGALTRRFRWVMVGVFSEAISVTPDALETASLNSREKHIRYLLPDIKLILARQVDHSLRLVSE